MSNLSDIVRYRRSQGGGVAGALAGGIKERLKEKFDPRQLINQQGLLAALFPGLKKYQAKTSGSSKTSGKSIDSSSINLSEVKPLFENIQFNTTITAKNLSVLPAIHRDFNVIRQNIGKLLKFEKIDARTKADMYFKEAAKREEMYESLLNKLKSSSKSPTKLNSGSADVDALFGKIMLLITAGTVIGLAFKGVQAAIDKIKEIDLKETVFELADRVTLSIGELLSSFEVKLKEFEIDNVISLNSNFKEALSKTSFSKLTEEQKNKLLDRQAKLEGALDKSTVANQSNNPGAMIFSDWQRKYGGEPGKVVRGEDNKTRTFAKFPSMEKGREAQRALWESDAYKDKPLSDALKSWVDPHNEKAFDNYQRGIAESIGISTAPENKESLLPVREGVSPLDKGLGHLSSYFGMRTMRELDSAGNATGKEVHRAHHGLDIGVKPNSNVYATHSGTVEKINIDNSVNKNGAKQGYGLYMRIKHDDGTYSLYAHLNETESGLNVGDKVKAGQRIGLSGGEKGHPKAGGSRAAHLHYEYQNQFGIPLDPIKTLDIFKGKKIGDPISSLSPSNGNMISSASFDVTMADLSNQNPVVIINQSVSKKNAMNLGQRSSEKDYLPFLFETVVV